MSKKLFTVNKLKFINFAFTLAETLIVMGIIGVVAALTLPNLNSSTANKEKVVKLQKIYQNLNDAYGRAVAVYGPTEEWCSGLSEDNCQKRFFERLTEFMKISKKCTVIDNCSFHFSSNTTGSGGGSTSKYAVILADGTTLSLITDSHKTTEGYAVFDIDIDGINKGADKHCYDTFELDLDPKKKGIVYYAYNKEGEKVFNTSRAYCTAWILEYGNMDYLKCNDELKFGGKTSCK